MERRVILGGPVATMRPDARYGLIDDGVVAIEDERIAFVGPAGALPSGWTDAPVTNVEGRLVTPGLIDCHTHVVFGGNRASEMELRLEGATYEEIARRGGGIVSTMRATQAASEDALLASALQRVDHLTAEGVTTLEVKSGYGLTVADEIKQLKVARRIADERPVRVTTTWLAAHAIPPGADRTRFLEEVAIEGLKQAHEAGLVDAVDGFCESIAFTADEIARLFDQARALGLPVKLHAEQLSHCGGASLAGRYGALSADHLEFITPVDAEAMTAAGTVAVLLPGACYTLGQAERPDVPALRAAGTKIAVATDCNPGSSPLTSILTAMNMACTLFRLTPEEALAGVTRNAAAALGRSDMGVIEVGNLADLVVWDVAEPAELSYRIGFNPLHLRIQGGTIR